MNSPWTQEDAIAVCRQIEEFCPQFGCHIALTGGTLYKDGPRKDLDLLFYRIRQTPKIDTDGLVAAMQDRGFYFIKGFGFCLKFEFQAKPIDCFFPEEPSGEYDQIDPSDVQHLEIERDLAF